MKILKLLRLSTYAVVFVSAWHDQPAQAEGLAQQRPVQQSELVMPAFFERRGDVYFADFGSDVFGNLQLTIPNPSTNCTLTVVLGEKLNADGTIDRKPPGSISCRELTLAIQPGTQVYEPVIPLKKGYQSSPEAIKMPAEIGNVTPFRYVEIVNCPAPLTSDSVRQIFVHTAFNDDASSFDSSDTTLNALWKLCKHTMKATTAFGVYIDGDRERKPYEADAYINFLSHLACDANPEVGRYSIEYLLVHPTWPTEWSFHMPMMTAEDYLATGDLTVARENWDALKAKLLMSKARADGLLRAGAIVDWPEGERDGYNGGVKFPNDRQLGPEYNTVVNAFYYHALKQMALLAQALNKTDEAKEFETKAGQVCESFNRVFFDSATDLYTDGEGSSHSSLHANMFALDFGLVPVDRQSKVADFIVSRGMACSVYGAQYLLETLYQSGKAEDALQLLTSHSQRSWWNMIQSGSTMTTEAWDVKFKGNLTWNHAWGAVPANIIARWLAGVRPFAPGYEKILIAPQPGSLQWFNAKVPTVRGPVFVQFTNADGRLEFAVSIPDQTTADVRLPVRKIKSSVVALDGKTVNGSEVDGQLTVENVSAGTHTLRVGSPRQGP
jgi:hypothetical protein